MVYGGDTVRINEWRRKMKQIWSIENTNLSNRFFLPIRENLTQYYFLPKEIQLCDSAKDKTEIEQVNFVEIGEQIFERKFIRKRYALMEKFQTNIILQRSIKQLESEIRKLLVALRNSKLFKNRRFRLKDKQLGKNF